MSRIIAIANLKGGVGKTTTAINLAAFLAAAGKEVVLVDLDPQANTTTALGVPLPETPPLQGILENPSQWLEHATRVSSEPIRLVPSCPGSDEACADCLDAGSVLALREALLGHAKIDYVLLDCPPTTGQLSAVGLRLADSVLIPVQAEPFAVQGLSQMLDLVKSVSDPSRPIEVEGVVITMFSCELDLSWRVLREVQGRFPNQLLSTVIPRDVSLAEATTVGKPIFAHDRRSAGAWAYLSLTKELLQNEHQETRKRPRRIDTQDGPAVRANSGGTSTR